LGLKFWARKWNTKNSTQASVSISKEATSGKTGGDPSMAADPKIKTLPELASRLADLRSHGKTIVHCHGVFDLMHIGHIRHFQNAKALGDVLIVTVTPIDTS